MPLLVLIKLEHGVPVQRFGLNELLLQELFVLAHGLKALSQLNDEPLVILVHLVELQGLVPEPVSLLLHVDQAGFLLGFDPLHGGLFFEVAHVFLHHVHLLLKSGQEV